MRLLVDAMCAEFGGIRTYVEGLLDAWAKSYPEDEIHVVTSAALDLPTFGHSVHLLNVRSPRFVGRPLAQTRHLHRLAEQTGAEAVIATAPTTSVRRFSVPLAVTILDLRHELRPEQFARRTRLLRRISYGRTYRLADTFLSISERSLEDLRRLHPHTRRTPAAITHLGGDHVLAWPQEPEATGPAVAFAHHTNKNPDLLLDGWAALAGRGTAVELLVLGVGSRRSELQARIDARGLSGWVSLSPFLPEQDFRKVLAEARMIVFPSDFEGFGLPVVEGMLLGHPVVIGPEPATREVAGGHAFEMADWSPAALADAVEAARAQDERAREAARTHASAFTWARTVEQTRAAVERMLAATG